MKLAFLGTSEFAVPALKALVEAGHDVVAVYTRAPKPAGRGQQERRTPVHELALSLGLAVRTPKPAQRGRSSGLQGARSRCRRGRVLRPHPAQGFLEAPVLGCINIHGSLLPRWRGAAPIHRAILAGDAETGVTIMRMDEGLDTGPMLLAERTPISAADTAESVHDRLADLGARLIVSTLDALVAQDHRAGAAARRRRHLRPQARQGRRRARLAPAGRRARAQGARLPSLAGDLVRRPNGQGGERIKVLACGLALAAGAPGTVSIGRDGFPDRRLRRRRAEAPEAAARRQVGAVGRRLPARLRAGGRHGAGAARRRAAADLTHRAALQAHDRI